MGLIANFDTDANFWEMNPTFKILGKFAKFHTSDTSKGKNASSKVMWAVALYVDTSSENALHRLSSKDKRDIISTDWIKDEKFKWNKYTYLIDEYKRTQLTASKRSLAFFKEKMEERETFLKEVPYTLDNAKELDYIVANTDKLFSMIVKLEAQVDKEESLADGGDAKGGRKESAGERKEI